MLIKGKDANQKVIEEAILEFIGVLGYAEASPQIIKSGKDNVILAINRSSLNKVRAGFLMSGKDIQIVKVSGVVNKVK